MVKSKDGRSNNRGRPKGSRNKSSLLSTPTKNGLKNKSALQTNDDTPILTNMSETIHPTESDITTPDYEDINKSPRKTHEESEEMQSSTSDVLIHDNQTYKSVLNKSIDIEMINPREKSTFLIQKDLCESEYNTDDASTVENDNSITSEFPNSVRLTMMYKLPAKTGDYSEEDAPIISIQIMNQMIKAMTNKIRCRVGPWKLQGRKTTLKMKDLVKELPEDIDFVESYVYDYSRFLRLGKTGYVRLHVFYSEETNLSEIESVIDQFRIPRTQFLEISHSNAISPVTIGTLTGSVEAMAHSIDFKKTFQYKFDLAELGLWWSPPRQVKKGEYNPNMAVLHIEIESKDLAKRQEIEKIFNHNNRGLDNHFFGVPMLLTTAFKYYADDDTKANLAMHSRKQVSLGKSITSTTIHGVGLNNWANSSKTTTLLRELMAVESITEKQILKGKKTNKFKGRLFYSIIPNNTDKTIKFHFTRANAREGRSVARGLPCFIKDYFKLEPTFFCTSDALSESLAGSWDYASRTFLSAQEKMEVDRLDDMEAEVNAEPTAFISKDHQRAMALDTDEVSIETRLTKGDAAPPPAINIDEGDDEHSALSGSTRESKAKRYADAAVKEVAAEYSGTILNMADDIGQKDDKIAELERLIRSMQQNDQQVDQETNTAMDIDNEDDVHKDNDDLLSFGTEHSTNSRVESHKSNNLELNLDASSDSKSGDHSDSADLDDMDDSDEDNSNKYKDKDRSARPQPSMMPSTRLPTALNINQQTDRNLKRRTIEKENSPVEINRSTRAKTSLRLAAQEKTSSSEEASDL